MIRRKIREGDVFLTATLPGWQSRVRVEQIITLRGKEHFVVVIREKPDVVYALRDRGNLFECDEDLSLGCREARSSI